MNTHSSKTTENINMVLKMLYKTVNLYSMYVWQWVEIQIIFTILFLASASGCYHHSGM